MRAARALLVQPPIHDFALYDLFLHPYGLLRLGEWLLQSGYDVELLDGLDDPGVRRDGGVGKFRRRVVAAPPVFADFPRRYARYGVSEDELRNRVAASRADVVLVASGMTYWYEGVAEVARVANEVLPGVPVAIGGVYATLLPDHARTIAPAAHIVAGGADGLGQMLVALGLPPLTGALPAMPSVELRHASRRLSCSGVVRLNEGCRDRCAYCASSILSPRFTAGTWQVVADYVGRLIDDGARSFAFLDDALLESADELLAPLLEWMIDSYGDGHLDIHLPNAVHVDLVTPAIASLLYRAGVGEVRLGLESMDPDFHRRYDRKRVVDATDDAVESLFTAGFRPGEVSGYLLAGLPGQVPEEVTSAIDALERRRVAPNIAEYSPVPGTPLFDEACRISRYPLSDEPLCHNNSVFPTACDRFTVDDMWHIKAVAREARVRVGSTGPRRSA